MKLLLFISLFSLDTIPPLDTMVNSLIIENEKQTISLIEEFKIDTKFRWFSYLPTLGTGFNQNGQLRPTVSFSIMSLFSVITNEKQRKQKIKAVKLQQEIELQKNINSLTTLLYQLNNLKNELEHMKKIYEIDLMLFKIEELKYEKAEIFPSEYLKSKRNIMIEEFKLKQKENEILKIESEILRMSYLI